MPRTKSVASIRAKIKETQDALLRAEERVTQLEHRLDELNRELDEAQVRAITAALKKSNKTFEQVLIFLGK